MTPDELRLATDPAARSDPEFVRRVMTGKRGQTRDRALGLLRVTTLVMGGVGGLLLALGALFAVLALANIALPPGVPTASLGTAATPGSIGGVFVGLAIWLWVPSRSLRTNGVPARATVVQVLGIGGGLRIKGTSIRASLSRVTMLLRVTSPNGAYFDVTHRERILDSDLSYLQVGATVPVRVSPSRPQKLAIDWDALG